MRNGDHGKTVQFSMMYVDCISKFRILDRAVHTNDITLFVESLTPITELFFTMNHHDYARWMSKYQMDLLNIDTSRPGLCFILEAGALTVRRTIGNSFSRCPVGLTLEQTECRRSFPTNRHCECHQ